MRPLIGPHVPPQRGVRDTLARSYGLVVFVTGLILVSALVASVAVSLSAQPPLGTAWPGVTFVQGLAPAGGDDVPYPGVSVYATRLVTPGQLDRLWTGAVLRRLGLFGLAALGAVGLTAAVSSYVLARRVAKPLADMARVASGLSVGSLRQRLVPPKADDELGEMASAFNQMLDRLQAAFDDLEQLTSHASHELRTSLAVIKAHLELGLSDDSQLSGEARAALAAADRLGAWTADILSMSSRSLLEPPGPVDLALLTAEAVDEYGRPGRSLTLDIPAEGVPLAQGHETWLRRALANLVDNALKHGPSDGPVRVSVVRRFDAVIASVTDQGPGIPEAEQEGVWDRYFRGAGARQAVKEGRGLGLALVRQAAEAAGGVAWLESRAREGSTFFLSIPVVGTTVGPAGPLDAIRRAL